MLRTFVLALSVFVFLGGCSSGGGDETQSAAQGGSQMGSGSFHGKVAETVDSGGYTYVKLEAGGEAIWAAGPVTQLAQGDEATVSLDMPMKDFHSETLGRDFDTVYFTASIETGPAHGHEDGEAQAPGGSSRTRVAPADVDAESIEPAAGGKTVAALWAQRTQLAGKSVTLRGRVVKFNAGIMGRNWLHVQDGTGDAAAQTHDLAVTTDATAKVGDVVTVTGTVTLDQDFGAGYKYPLLVEKADVKVESSSESR